MGLEGELFGELAMFVGNAGQFAGELEHFDGAGAGSMVCRGCRCRIRRRARDGVK